MPLNVGGVVGRCACLSRKILDIKKKAAYGVVAKGNGEAWVILEKHMTISAGGGMPGQSYPCVLVPIGVERRNELRND